MTLQYRDPISNLALEMRPAEDGESYAFGAIVNDAFVELTRVKAGGLEADVKRAAGWTYSYNAETKEGSWQPPEQQPAPAPAPVQEPAPSEQPQPEATPGAPPPSEQAPPSAETPPQVQ